MHFKMLRVTCFQLQWVAQMACKLPVINAARQFLR